MDEKIVMTRRDLNRLQAEAIKEYAKLHREEYAKALSAVDIDSRIEELENFEWNDPHMYIHERLAHLRNVKSSIAKGKV